MKYITSVLIDPWRNKARARVMLAGCVGCFGVCLLILALSYTMAGSTLQANIIFQLMRQAIQGLIAIPISFYLSCKKGGRFWVLATQTASLALVLANPHVPLICAFGYAFVCGPFWAFLNIRMAELLSLKSNAREMALGQVLTLVVSSVGTALAGYMLQINLYEMALGIGILLVLLATQQLFKPFATGGLIRGVFDLIAKKKPSSRMTFYTGILGIVQDSCMPAWFRVMNISPLATGAMLALQPILAFVFTPVVGNVVQNGTQRSVRIGGCMILVGWALMSMVVHQPILLTLVLGLLATGFNMIEASEITRWTKMRSIRGTTAREYLLTFGRVPGVLGGFSLVFLAPTLYPIAPLAVALLFIFGINWRSIKAARTKV